MNRHRTPYSLKPELDTLSFPFVMLSKSAHGLLICEYNCALSNWSLNSLWKLLLYLLRRVENVSDFNMEMLEAADLCIIFYFWCGTGKCRFTSFEGGVGFDRLAQWQEEGDNIANTWMLGGTYYQKHLFKTLRTKFLAMNALLLDWPSLFTELLFTSHILNSVAMCLCRFQWSSSMCWSMTSYLARFLPTRSCRCLDIPELSPLFQNGIGTIWHVWVVRRIFLHAYHLQGLRVI